MLLGSTVVEVATGLFFVYLLLSLLCSGINEWIAGILKLRAKTLREGIVNLLDDPDLVASFYNHPLIRGLSRSDGLPSYIPARTFARVLTDLLPSAAESGSPRSRVEVYKTLREVLTDPSFADSSFGRTLRILLDEGGINLDRVEETSGRLQELDRQRRDLMAFLQQAEPGAENAQWAVSLLSTVDEMEASLRRTEEEISAGLLQIQENIEAHFDAAMDRVSGWYKRRAQLIIVGIAAGVSLLLNADTIAIANELIADETLRTTLVAYAEQVTAGEDDVTTLSELSDALGIEMDDPLALPGALGLPIGWRGSELTSLGAWLTKALGLLVTVVAVSMGAPFWFDLLVKVSNIRMTGRKPDGAPQAP